MAFRPNIGDQLEIDQTIYRVTEHPAAPGMPYGQEGRQGVVFQLVDERQNRLALKVFKPRFRVPSLVGSTARLATFATIPGLAVCARTVLTPRQHTALLRQYPDLTYAVLMPWIPGPSWMDCVLERRSLSLEQSLALARAFANLLADMEERGIAHGDLSGPNLLIPGFAQPAATPTVALVDVEQLYAPGLDRPDVIVSGSSGYAHHTAAQGVWGATSDRFAGAILLAEILGWGSAEVRAAAGEESYFEPGELQQPGKRYDALLHSLSSAWGAGIARLVERAWRSDTLADCPTFGEWLVALPDEVPAPKPAHIASAPTATANPEAGVAIHTLLTMAGELRDSGQYEGARQIYQRALGMLTPDDGLAAEIRLLINNLDKHAESAPTHIAQETTPVGAVAPVSVDRPTHRGGRWPWIVAIGALLAILVGSAGYLQSQANERMVSVAPTTTQTQPTATMQPTTTPTPTATVAPTMTPAPTATIEPTATLQPTITTIAPSQTPIPTAVPPTPIPPTAVPPTPIPPTAVPPTAVPPSISVAEGNWIGTTAQGEELSFTVRNGQISDYNYVMIIGPGQCRDSFNNRPPTAINDNRASLTIDSSYDGVRGYIEIQWMFTSPNTVEGTIHLEKSGLGVRGCNGVINITFSGRLE